MPALDRGCLSLRRPAAVKTWLSHGHMCEPLSWDHTRVSLSPEPGLDVLPCFFPGHGLRSAHGWARAPHPGMGAAPEPCGPVAMFCGCPDLWPGWSLLPPAGLKLWLPPPPCHVATSTRAGGKPHACSFFVMFGGLLLQETPGRGPRNIIKRREGEREWGKRQGLGRFGKTI